MSIGDNRSMAPTIQCLVNIFTNQAGLELKLKVRALKASEIKKRKEERPHFHIHMSFQILVDV